MGGEYKFDDALKKAPQVFRQYAEQLWKKNILETWDKNLLLHSYRSFATKELMYYKHFLSIIAKNAE